MVGCKAYYNASGTMIMCHALGVMMGTGQVLITHHLPILTIHNHHIVCDHVFIFIIACRIVEKVFLTTII